MKKTSFLFILFALIIAFKAQINAQESPHQKSGWYIGFGLGTGDAGWEVDGKSYTLDDYFEGVDSVSPKVTINFGVGAILSPSIHIGLDISAVRQEGSISTTYGDFTAALQITNTLGVLTYFPMNEGLFLRIGAGVSNISQEFQFLGEQKSNSYSGFAYLGGVGYALWIGQTFNLCLNFDYSAQSYSDNEAPDNSHFWAFYVSFYWF